MGSARRSENARSVGGRPATVQTTSSSACLQVESAGAGETRGLGEVLGRLLRPGDLVLLVGRIGAGKTCFTQGVARGMGLSARVTSPSFTLANVYEAPAGGFPLFHLDLWRMGSPLEALGIGLDEYLAGAGACVVEWPDVAESVLPAQFVRIRFEIDDDRRRLEICPIGGGRAATLVEQLGCALAAPSGPLRRAGASGD
jgi:tRNA threonylcarbamoyladenosine biosynthesis protein TsaE